eukprot:703818-Prorocentrum_minimum.AAC.1
MHGDPRRERYDATRGDPQQARWSDEAYGDPRRQLSPGSPEDYSDSEEVRVARRDWPTARGAGPTWRGGIGRRRAARV